MTRPPPRSSPTTSTTSRAADRDLGAFRVVRGGEAIAEAEKVDEQEDLANLPLAGVPVAVKENTAGRRPADLERLGRRPHRRSPRPTTRWSAGCAAPARSSSA